MNMDSFSTLPRPRRNKAEEHHHPPARRLARASARRRDAARGAALHGRQFARGIIMPNLVPPVTTVADAAAYRDRILAARPPAADFEPLMTCYLTDHNVARRDREGLLPRKCGSPPSSIRRAPPPMRITA